MILIEQLQKMRSELAGIAYRLGMQASNATETLAGAEVVEHMTKASTELARAIAILEKHTTVRDGYVMGSR